MAIKLWKINCMEDRFPGMWQRWFKHQCAAVGWAGKWGFHLKDPSERGRGWIRARRLLEQIKPGDWIVVSLRGHRIGRIGEVNRKAVGDADWGPFVPPRAGARDRYQRDGEMGRRIVVRWALPTGPDHQEM